MKNHIGAYLISIIPQVGMSITEFEGALRWLDTNYDQWYTACSVQENLYALSTVLEKNSDNFIAILTYCDICYEYGKRMRIDLLVSSEPFKSGSEILTNYIELRDTFKKYGGDELAHWSSYNMYIKEKYKK